MVPGFLGITPIRYVASITQEKQFSTCMLKPDTQIVFLDELSENSLQSDMAKVVLQGGYMPKSTKHKEATFVLNNSPYYITTNDIPYFGSDDANAKRRIVAFETTSLPSTSTNVEKWMRKNSMHCIVWAADEIDRLNDLVDKTELWYETAQINPDENEKEAIDFCAGGGESLLNVEEVRNMSMAQELSTLEASNAEKPADFIHEDFKSLADKVFEKKSLEREIYLEKERVYREEQGNALEEESEDDEPVINSKRHHRQIKNLLKHNFYIRHLNSTHLVSNQRKIERGKSVKITDEEHGWRLVLGKPLEAFDVDLFFQHYPETTGYILRIRELVRYRVVEWDASEPKDPVHKAKLAKERKAIAAYCKRIESEEETESQVLLHSEAKTRTACKEDDKDSVAESSEADIYEKPEISEEKESMPSQSSDDNKEENKDSNVHSDDDKEENKGSYVHSDGVREENKGSYVHLSSSLPVRNQQRKGERNEDDISFLERLGKIFRFTQ